jgi:hypothetical protein
MVSTGLHTTPLAPKIEIYKTIILLVALRAFENGVQRRIFGLRRDEVTGG